MCVVLIWRQTRYNLSHQLILHCFAGAGPAHQRNLEEPEPPDRQHIDLPFEMQRRQFPVRPAFIMSINKGQRQTLAKAGVYLPKPVFTHGQLYFAFSRVGSWEQLVVCAACVAAARWPLAGGGCAGRVHKKHCLHRGAKLGTNKFVVSFSSVNSWCRHQLGKVVGEGGGALHAEHFCVLGSSCPSAPSPHQPNFTPVREHGQVLVIQSFGNVGMNTAQAAACAAPPAAASWAGA